MGLFRRDRSEASKPASPSATSPAPSASADAKRGFWSRLGDKLGATREQFNRGFEDLFLGKRQLDETLLEELETLLIGADVGLPATAEIIDDIAGRIRRHELADVDAVYSALREHLRELLRPCAQPLSFGDDTPFTILAVGINGAGKTTTLGKLVYRLREAGHSVVVAAGDTFRAAAREQLAQWTERAGATLVAQTNGDAAAVAHDALQIALSRKAEVLLIDTAGRLHTQTGLMDELKKIKRVLAKQRPEAPHEVLLVLDGGIGQNALTQLAEFDKAVGVTGLCITKLDGTAKGGVLFAIAKQRAVPIRFIGVGESAEDLRPFDPDEFVDALLPPRRP